jgi:hypothetical protein
VDYNGDGLITGDDFTALIGRLGKTISIPALPSVALLSAAPATSASGTITAATSAQTQNLSSVAGTNALSNKKKLRHGHR